MALESLLERLKAAESVNPISSSTIFGVTADPARTAACTLVTHDTPVLHKSLDVGSSAATSAKSRSDQREIHRDGALVGGAWSDDGLSRHTWFVHYAEIEPVFVSCYPPTTRNELLVTRPGATDVTPAPPPN